MHTPMNWNGKKILITGINGFIGSHLARTLLDSGAVVHGISRKADKWPYLESQSLIGHVKVHHADLLDFSAIESIVQSHQWDAIFHLASQPETNYSIQHPLETIQTNVMGTVNLLESIRLHTPQTPFVLGGSIRAFGAGNKEGESIHPYDASKEAMESIAQSYFREYHLRGAIAKNTNIYGPNDFRFTRLIPMIMHGIFSGENVSLYGDGTIKRDFMYVKDAVQGLLLLAHGLTQKNELGGKTFLFATGRMIEIRDIVKIIEKASPQKTTITFNQQLTRHERELPSLSEELAQTHNTLGWKPTHSLEEGMRETLQGYQQYFSSHTEAKK
ncbi:MAG: NAD(P)-dependent oxidoreductase [Candidatus Iainarchaeum archaeon]|uniref:NAD(P)-dependent oxidoreductase n=1 Tax=Candidatus Iainarchaeum sp. TaxID=3101447 RepID=A0A7T9DIU8_9ARCH|nr:MAG: NAD(P)-dependent oxidoreductase [Candidatus Diapherotrites archaeon]